MTDPSSPASPSAGPPAQPVALRTNGGASSAPSTSLAPRARAARSDHPLVVTIEKRSAPRAVFSGDRVLEIDLPVGSRVIYPRPPIDALKDVDAAIRYAINRPLGSDPLHAKLRPGMKVVIAIDDVSVPLPPMRRPDARERVLTVVLGTLTILAKAPLSTSGLVDATFEVCQCCKHVFEGGGL